MNVYLAEQTGSHDEPARLVGIAGTLDTAQALCAHAARPYRPFLAPPSPPRPRLDWRRSPLAEDADDPDEQSPTGWFADVAGRGYRITEVEVTV